MPDNPAEPVCIGCGLTPDELDCYTELADDAGLTPTEYVMQEEGTYNKENGHFTCDPCYIGMGMPTSPRGWKAP